MDITLSSEAFHSYVNAALAHINKALKLVIRLFLVEDLVDSLKVSPATVLGGGPRNTCGKVIIQGKYSKWGFIRQKRFICSSPSTCKNRDGVVGEGVWCLED